METLHSCFKSDHCSPLVASTPEFDDAISTGGKESVKVGAAVTSRSLLLLGPPPPPPLVECEAPFEELAAKQLTLRPRDGRRLLQQDEII